MPTDPQNSLLEAKTLPYNRRLGIYRKFRSNPKALRDLPYNWPLIARKEQLPPEGDWDTWFILAGRGFGKTRAAAEWIRSMVDSGTYKRICLVGKDPADCRDVMIEGKSGILNIYPPDDPNYPKYEPSKKRITWPNGAVAEIKSAEDPDDIRGPEYDCFWADELAAWRYVQDSWDNLQFATRLNGPKGHTPRGVVTTTPKPIKLIKDILKEPGTRKTGGSTFDNAANLSPKFLEKIKSKYEGTRLGRQELHAELLDELEGALWNRELLERQRVNPKDVPRLTRILVSVDPMISKDAAEKRKMFPPETGMVVSGLGIDGNAYIFQDLSFTSSPDEWGWRAINAYHDNEADNVVAEQNQGGDMVKDVIHTRDPNVPVKLVHASRGKWTRAEPIQGLYQQGKVFHVGFFSELEDQMCNWSGGINEPSPDRLDALVWGLTELCLKNTVLDVEIDPTLGHTENYWNI